mgnify:CR=1 FL=1
MEEEKQFKKTRKKQPKKSISKKYQAAWINGQTGFPLVDACMRCLKETGYLNFKTGGDRQLLQILQIGRGCSDVRHLLWMLFVIQGRVHQIQ